MVPFKFFMQVQETLSNLDMLQMLSVDIVALEVLYLVAGDLFRTVYPRPFHQAAPPLEPELPTSAALSEYRELVNMLAKSARTHRDHARRGMHTDFSGSSDYAMIITMRDVEWALEQGTAGLHINCGNWRPENGPGAESLRESDMPEALETPQPGHFLTQNVQPYITALHLHFGRFVD